jgi:hypothetical protein
VSRLIRQQEENACINETAMGATPADSTPKDAPGQRVSETPPAPVDDMGGKG